MTLSAPHAQSVAVHYSTVAGIATAGVDYVAAIGEVVFAPGETTSPVRVAVIDDTLIQGPETVALALKPVAERADPEAGPSVKQAPIYTAHALRMNITGSPYSGPLTSSTLSCMMSSSGPSLLVHLPLASCRAA